MAESSRDAGHGTKARRRRREETTGAHRWGRRPHPAEVVVIAIGNAPNPLLLRAAPELDTGDDGTTVILAMGAGRRAAAAISEYVNQAVDQRQCA